MVDDPDETLALVADLTGATDPALRALARQLAGRLFLDLSRRGPVRPRGVGRLVEQPYRPDGGDLDLDASMEGVLAARAAHEALDVEQLRIRSWVRPATALCLLVDRSGSMGGKPLATAALAAAAVASRSPSDYSVLAFGRDVVVAKGQGSEKADESVVDDVLALRGFGTTDLAGALLAAGRQLGRSRAARRVTVVLSDCRATVEGDPVSAAMALDEVVVIAPDDDAEEAKAFATMVGAAFTTVTGPSAVADALSRVLT